MFRTLIPLSHLSICHHHTAIAHDHSRSRRCSQSEKTTAYRDCSCKQDPPRRMNSNKMKPEHTCMLNRKCGFHYSIIVHMVLCLLTYICYFSLMQRKIRSTSPATYKHADVYLCLTGSYFRRSVHAIVHHFKKLWRVIILLIHSNT